MEDIRDSIGQLSSHSLTHSLTHPTQADLMAIDIHAKEFQIVTESIDEIVKRKHPPKCLSS